VREKAAPGSTHRRRASWESGESGGRHAGRPCRDAARVRHARAVFIL